MVPISALPLNMVSNTLTFSQPQFPHVYGGVSNSTCSDRTPLSAKQNNVYITLPSEYRGIFGIVLINRGRCEVIFVNLQADSQIRTTVTFQVLTLYNFGSLRLPQIRRTIFFFFLLPVAFIYLFFFQGLYFIFKFH